LIEAEYPPKNIEQWYERIINLDRYWRESRRKERLRDRKKTVLRTNMLVNNKGV